MNLSIPKFLSVEKCNLILTERQHDHGCVRFMALDPVSGASERYSVVELDLLTGRLYV